MRSYALITAAAILGFACPVLAQNNAGPEMQCQEQRGRDGQVRHCEIREQTTPYAGQLTVDGGVNGGVSVKGWNRAEVLVRTKVESWAETESAARSVASSVRVDVSAGKVTAQGPAGEGRTGWAVSYEIFTPRQSNLKLTTHNGGIKIVDVIGNVEFAAVNGGIHLTRVAGNVTGRTTNGGVHVQLDGDRWNGQGLDVTTTNGGVHLNVPANYSAHVEASTVNGGVRADYPVNPSGPEGSRKRLSLNLGAGGAPLKLATTNGGVTIRKI